MPVLFDFIEKTVRVLIVDDEADVLGANAGQLQEYPLYAVDACSSAREADEKLQETLY
jgi:hypothetical protein